MRHDVDLDLMSTLQMAIEETRDDIKSTYFFMLENDFYNVFSPSAFLIISSIRELGHEIGIHYNPKTPESLMFEFKKIFKLKNPKLTAHKPATTGEYWANEYKPEDYKYLSDSGMNWREGCFCQHLDEPKLYVNTHPEWWTNWRFNRYDTINDLAQSKHLDINSKLFKFLEWVENEYLPKIRKGENNDNTE